ETSRAKLKLRMAIGARLGARPEGGLCRRRRRLWTAFAGLYEGMGQIAKIRQYPMAIVAADRFRMKLNAPYGPTLVADAHDDAVGGPSDRRQGGTDGRHDAKRM